MMSLRGQPQLPIETMAKTITAWSLKKWTLGATNCEPGQKLEVSAPRCEEFVRKGLISLSKPKAKKKKAAKKKAAKKAGKRK